MNENELYFKNNFTQEENNINLEIEKLNVSCITSNNNTFTIDKEGNLKVNSIKTKEPLINELYPVGSIYMSIEETNPTYFFGGVWEQIKDTFLLGCGSRFPNGTTGGEVEHWLKVEELPSHTHNFWYFESSPVLTPNNQGGGQVFDPERRWLNQTDRIDYTGGNQAHNNMPPYLAVYIWKRIS